MRLQGKVALITGAARGQGAAEARLFAQEGAKVVLADVSDQEGSLVAAKIAEAGGDALYVHLDVTDEHDWDRAIQSAVSSFGKIDILVNNAGIWRRGHVLETSSEQWDLVLGVNAKGVFLGTKAARPEMRKAGGGSIINISSTAGLVGSRTSSAYSASKGAVRATAVSRLIESGQTWSPMSVSMGPGCMELARMPSAAYWMAVDLVKMRTAPLDAL